jgi:tRNA pseudouridine55 synthase
MENQPPFGLTLLVDKPLTWTSFDLVNKLRYTAKHATGRKKIKVGHAGTLDPLATGLMLICVGSHTKTINDLTGMDKSYDGTFLLGSTTPSYDLETEIDQTFDLPKQDIEELKLAASQFLGDQNQVPPIFSAKKIDGQKAYDLARKGKEVVMKPNPIHISEFEIEADNFPEIAFKLSCSKGTYVRSLAFDYGKALNSGSHLTKLRRTRIGEFLLDNALSVEQAMEAIKDGFQKYLDSIAVKS